MTFSFVATSAQPDYVPQVVDWLREEFWHAGGPSREQQIATMLAQPDRSEETFVLLDDNVPVGTASLVNNDLPSRPELTPWLASVLVLPLSRGRVQRTACPPCRGGRQLSATILWLYTWSAVSVYAKLGWQRVRNALAGAVALMPRRALINRRAPAAYILRHVRAHVHAAQFPDEVGG